jgi:hypothetical protein
MKIQKKFIHILFILYKVQIIFLKNKYTNKSKYKMKVF